MNKKKFFIFILFFYLCNQLNASDNNFNSYEILKWSFIIPSIYVVFKFAQHGLNLFFNKFNDDPQLNNLLLSLKKNSLNKNNNKKYNSDLGNYNNYKSISSVASEVSWDKVFINESLKSELLNFVRSYFSLKNNSIFLPSFLFLYGLPGSNKTSIIKGIANELGLSILILDPLLLEEAVFNKITIENILDHAKSKNFSIVHIKNVERVGKALYNSIRKYLSIGLPNRDILVTYSCSYDPVVRDLSINKNQFIKLVIIDSPQYEERYKIIESFLLSECKNIIDISELNIEYIANISSSLNEKDIILALKKAIEKKYISSDKNFILKNSDVIAEIKTLKKNDAIVIGETESFLNTGLNSRDHFMIEIPSVTFEQVIGLEHVKKQVEFISNYLKNPEAYNKINIRLPKGILFTGPPGCGKTLIAKAIATMAGVPVLIINGSDFINKYVGEGARKVRELFAMAKVEAPVIIFIDEIDAIGGKRSTSGGGEGGEKEYTQTLNALLTEMDGFATGNNNVIVIASTNRDTNYLDPALNRRFENKYHFSLPTFTDRVNIFQLYLKSVPCHPDVSIEDLALKTTGYSGANIEYIVNLSKYYALDRMKLNNIPLSEFQVLNIDITNAYNTFSIGYELKNLSINDKEFYKTAIHESGHTLCMCLQKNYPRIFELVTITPRDAGNGTILGFAQNFDKEEFQSYSKENFEQFIIVSLGGLVAEEIFFNESFDGVGSDLMHASSLAKAMVKKFGMTDTILYSGGEDELSLIEREMVEKILFDCKAKCKELLLNNKNLLEKLANELFIKKTLTRNEVYKIIKKDKI